MRVLDHVRVWHVFCILGSFYLGYITVLATERA